MLSKYYRAFIGLGLSLSLVSVSFMSLREAHASTGTELKQQINDLAQKKQLKKDQVNKTNQKLKDNQAKQTSVQQQLADLEQQVAVTNSKITVEQHKVNNTENDVTQLKKEIKVVEERIKRRDELLKQRVKAMYVTSGSADYLELILSSNNFGDLVGRVVVLSTIATQDKKILDQQKADKISLDTKGMELQTKLSALQQDLKDLDSLKSSLSNQKNKQQTLLSTLKSQEKSLENEKLSQNEIEANLADQQAAAQKAYNLWKEEQTKSPAQTNQQSPSNSTTPSTSRSSSATNSSSLLSWPVYGGYISSPYGQRSFDNEFHPGIDIADAKGTPIHAAADGVVFRAYVSSSYGNCVMITHYINGKKYTTVYAHMNSYIVSTGQVVKRGQVIGYMGNTGESFGNHLHFEVYSGNWTPPPHPGTVNPLSVLPPR